MRKTRITLLFFVVLLLTTACSERFEYDKKAATNQTEQIVTFTNNGDYQAIFDLLNENVKNQLTVDTLRDAWVPIIASAGGFKAFEKVTTQGVVQDGYRYIVVSQKCQYEETVLNYTITYTEDMKIVALYLN